MLNNVNFEFVTVVGNGSVYQTKSGLGYAFYYNLEGVRQPRKVVTGKTEEELEAKALKFLEKENDNYIMAKEAERIALEEMNKPVVKTFSEVAEEWYTKEYGNRRKKGEIAFSTFENRWHSLQKVKKYIGDVDVTCITNEIAKKLFDSCSVKEDGTYYSESSVNKDQQVFKFVMEYARQQGYCDQIIDKVKLSDQLTVPNKDDRFLDRDDLNKLFEALKENERYYTLVKLLISTGLRQEEAFALHVNDFKVKKNGLVEVRINKAIVEEEGHQYNLLNRTKTDRSNRVVLIPIKVYDMLMEYYNNCINNESQNEKNLRSMNGTVGYIFVNEDMKRMNPGFSD